MRLVYCIFAMSKTDNTTMNTDTTTLPAKPVKKLTIRQKVDASIDTLRACADHRALREWAVANGIDNRAAFPKFKDALLEHGIDYEALRDGRNAELEAARAAKITHHLTLITDAKARTRRFGICHADGTPAWHGRFFDDDRDFDGEQSSGELACAKKAVWLASKVKDTLGVPALRLTLKVDAQWLCYQDHAKQKGYILTQLARKHDIELYVEWIAGSTNPADALTICHGFQKYDVAATAQTAEPV
jgi:hypothetical protein